MNSLTRSVWRASLAGGLMLLAAQVWAAAIPGIGANPGDVTIVSLKQPGIYTLMCGNGGTVDYGSIVAGQSAYVTSGALGSCNKQAIWVQVAGQTVCKGLTDYRTDYAPITFNIDPSSGTCTMGAAPSPEPTPSGGRVIGGWVGDEGWDKPLPASFGKLDVLNLGYITCVSTLRNGERCSSPGQRNANDGPPAALAGAAKVVTYVLGGDGCNADGWDVNKVVNAGGGRWGGVDIDDECDMRKTAMPQINATVQGLAAKGKTSIITYLTDADKSWLAQVLPAPTYYAAMAFWATEFCSATNPAPGCTSSGPWGGQPYETFIPTMINQTLSVIGRANSRKMILGLHALGINEATVDFWCQQVKDNNLGGVFVSFIEKIPPPLFNRLRVCLAQ